MASIDIFLTRRRHVLAMLLACRRYLFRFVFNTFKIISVFDIGCMAGVFAATERETDESVNMNLHTRDQKDFMAFYCAAIRVREQARMPAVGLTIDRRTFNLLADVYNLSLIHI